jgi:predicted DsbA family dithiol-disulfide isomerase
MEWTMSVISQHRLNDPRTVLHWYDFLCPFCYIGQNRNRILVQHGLDVVELAFQAHPEIPAGGIVVGVRNGEMYTRLEREAREVGLPLHWPSRLPNTREALRAAEWARRYQPREFPKLHSALFQAHFALGEDIGDRAVIERHASASGIELTALEAAWADGRTAGLVRESEELGRKCGVQGTPAWFLNGQLISGLRSIADFELLAKEVARTSQKYAPVTEAGEQRG